MNLTMLVTAPRCVVHGTPAQVGSSTFAARRCGGLCGRVVSRRP